METVNAKENLDPRDRVRLVFALREWRWAIDNRAPMNGPDYRRMAENHAAWCGFLDRHAMYEFMARKANEEL